jgi:hypothetical protein
MTEQNAFISEYPRLKKVLEAQDTLREVDDVIKLNQLRACEILHDKLGFSTSREDMMIASVIYLSPAPMYQFNPAQYGEKVAELVKEISSEDQMEAERRVPEGPPSRDMARTMTACIAARMELLTAVTYAEGCPLGDTPETAKAGLHNLLQHSERYITQLDAGELYMACRDAFRKMNTAIDARHSDAPTAPELTFADHYPKTTEFFKEQDEMLRIRLRPPADKDIRTAQKDICTTIDAHVTGGKKQKEAIMVAAMILTSPVAPTSFIAPYSLTARRLVAEKNEEDNCRMRGEQLPPQASHGLSQTMIALSLVQIARAVDKIMNGDGPGNVVDARVLQNNRYLPQIAGSRLEKVYRAAIANLGGVLNRQLPIAPPIEKAVTKKTPTKTRSSGNAPGNT